LKSSVMPKRRGHSPKAVELRPLTIQPVGKPPELVPSALPELSTHVERRRWRGRYNVDGAERPQTSLTRPKLFATRLSA
jgi:hypothetical protein